MLYFMMKYKDGKWGDITNAIFSMFYVVLNYTCLLNMQL